MGEPDEAGEWESLNGVFYEWRREIYALPWGVDIDASRVACAPFGGPVAIVRDDRKIVKNAAGQLRSGTVQTFNAAGAPLGKFLWDRPSRLMAFGWTEQEALLCVDDAGGVFPYSVDGELLPWQLSLGAECAAQRVAEALVLPNGVVALTREGQLFAVPDVQQPRVQRLADVPPLEAFPHAVTVVPRGGADGGLLVILAVGETIWTVDSTCCTDAATRFGRILRMEVTQNGALVALLSASGMLWVVRPDMRAPALCEFDAAAAGAGDGHGVASMAWCGADAVVLTLPGALLCVGPAGGAVRWPLDAPAALAPECDGLRVLTADSHGLLRRVPEPLARCCGVGSTAPGAMLTDAMEAFDRGAARADEALRAAAAADGGLTGAVADCLAAALHAWEPASQRALLRAAAFGAAHLTPEARGGTLQKHARGAAGAHAETCRTLRVLNAVRSASGGGIPLTGAQHAAQLGGAQGLLQRLLAARCHLLALRLADALGAPPARVLLHWAACKMGAALALSDRALLDALMAKLRGVPGIPFGDVAAEAHRRGRPRLAALLLDFEARAGEAVPLLSGMGEDDRALTKAVESGDPDLIYLAVFALYRRQPAFASFAEALARRPDARNLFAAYARRTDPQLLRDFLTAAGDAAGGADAALQAALAGLAPGAGPAALEAPAVAKLLEQAAEAYGRCRLELPAWAAAEAARLVKAQVELDKTPPAGTTRRAPFLGRSLNSTVYQCLLEGQAKAAARLRSDFRLSERAWGWARARAAAQRGDWDALAALADEKKPAAGHTSLVELAMERGAPKTELARLIARVPDPAARADWYAATGMPQQAAAAAAEANEAAAKPLSNLFARFTLA